MKYIFKYTPDKELIEKYERSKLDLYWLEYQTGNTTGQPYNHYLKQWKEEGQLNKCLEDELRKRGLIQ